MRPESNAPSAVSVTFFAGLRGAGKTRTILSLLEFKPAEERWTLIVEEIGNTMPDPGSLAAIGVAVRGAPYGCPCCSGNITMRVSLARALRETRPHRILVELPWGTHLANTRLLFSDPLLSERVQLTAVVAIVDGESLMSGTVSLAEREALYPSDTFVIFGTRPSPQRLAALSEAFRGKRIVASVQDDGFRRILDLR